jgi:hypothetical protein
MTLSEFLLKLATEPGLQAKFNKDPDGVAKKYELDAKGRQLLKAGKLHDIRIEIHAQIDLDEKNVAMIWVHFPPIHWVFKSEDKP